MAFWDIDTDVDHAQQDRQKAGSASAQSDPDIQAALRGQFTGKYAELAAKFPAAWPASIRNAQVAQSIAYDKGIDTSGLDSSNNFTATNNGTPFAVQIAPYVIGGVTGAAALSGAGGAGSGVTQAVAGGGPATTQAAVPAALAAPGGGGVMGGVGAGVKAALGIGGKGGTMGVTDWLGPVLNAGLNIYGQSRQIAANAEGLDKSLAATKYAADSSAASQKEALDFQKAQYAYDAQVAETNRKANYDQFAARNGMLGSVGEMLGLPARQTPGYVPLPSNAGVVPGAPAGAPGAGPAAAPTAASMDPAAMTPKIQESFQRQFGRPGTPEEVQQVIGYAMKPDLYSDGQWRQGPNDYLVQRVGSKSASADPRLAGTDGIIPAPAGYQPGAPGQHLTAAAGPMGGSVMDYIKQAAGPTGQLMMPAPQTVFRPMGGPVSAYL